MGGLFRKTGMSKRDMGLRPRGRGWDQVKEKDMATIRKHWMVTLSGIVFLAAVCVLSALLATGRGGARADEDAGPLPALDVAAHEQITSLRGQLGLSNHALSAIGCSRQDAEGIFATVRQWYQANKADLAALLRAEEAARADLRRAVGAVSSGRPIPADKSLAGVNTALTDAVSARRRFVRGLAEEVAERLSTSQAATLKAAVANPGASGNCRYVTGLTAAQVKALAGASYRKGLVMASARTPQARAAAESAFRGAVSSVLTPAQTTELAAARQRIDACMAGVLEAEQNVLAAPAISQAEVQVSE